MHSGGDCSCDTNITLGGEGRTLGGDRGTLGGEGGILGGVGGKAILGDGGIVLGVVGTTGGGVWGVWSSSEVRAGLPRPDSLCVQKLIFC